jgi:hypothetical protein
MELRPDVDPSDSTQQAAHVTGLMVTQSSQEFQNYLKWKDGYFDANVDPNGSELGANVPSDFVVPLQVICNHCTQY